MVSTTLDRVISIRKAPAVTATAAGLSSVCSHLSYTAEGHNTQHHNDETIQSTLCSNSIEGKAVGGQTAGSKSSSMHRHSPLPGPGNYLQESGGVAQSILNLLVDVLGVNTLVLEGAGSHATSLQQANCKES